MSEGNRSEPEYVEITPTRLDLKTRIGIMAAIIYSTADLTTMTAETAVKEAIEAAVKLENAADAMTKKVKRDNPIPRKIYR